MATSLAAQLHCRCVYSGPKNEHYTDLSYLAENMGFNGGWGRTGTQTGW